LALFLLYKNRQHALRFALSFVKREFQLVFKSMAELWDITSDGMRAPKHSVAPDAAGCAGEIVHRLQYAADGLCACSLHLHDDS
jgi:hypothetical protein